MTVTINGTTGIVNNATDLNYTGTLTGGTGVVNLGSGQVYKDASGSVGFGTTTVPASNNIRVAIAGRAGSASNAGLELITDGGGGAALFSNNGAGLQIYSFTGSAGSESYTERARITAAGEFLLGQTASSGSGKQEISFPVSSQVGFRFNMTDTTYNNAVMEFRTNTPTRVGYIYCNASSTAYNTSSDYRLKEDIAPMTGALAKVQALKPVTYKWKLDGSDGEGFIAHELQEVVPQCVTGEKDAVDAEGNPVYQGIDTSFLVATLTAAIQELKAELDTVKAELAAMKGQA